MATDPVSYEVTRMVRETVWILARDEAHARAMARDERIVGHTREVVEIVAMVPDKEIDL